MFEKKLNDAILDYYKLKEKYENKYKQLKLKIINNPLDSIKEKQQKFQQMQKLCINCNNKGGTIFSNRNGILRATCGHISNPCKLNIEINPGKYLNSEDLAFKLKNNLDIKKLEMIKIKLDFLFGYISEEKALENFNILKTEISKDEEQYRTVEIFYLNKVDNSEKNNLIKEGKKELYSQIEKIKEFIKVYNINKNKILLKNAVEVYTDNIIPLLENINNLEYIERTVNKIDDQNVLVQKSYTISSLEYPIISGKIIVNKK